jgi:REP element-mobilizing transposase RayT
MNLAAHRLDVVARENAKNLPAALAYFQSRIAPSVVAPLALQRRYWKGVLWSPSYFAASCGGAPIEILRTYIEQQQTPD